MKSNRLLAFVGILALTPALAQTPAPAPKQSAVVATYQRLLGEANQRVAELAQKAADTMEELEALKKEALSKVTPAPKPQATPAPAPTK